MTSNQVSYASVQVSKQVAEETEQHNRITEAETQRHNEATESINRLLADVEQQKTWINYDINQTKNQLQREYNDIMKQYYSATTEEKEWYDQQIADIQRMQAEADRDYKSKMADVAKTQNSLNQSQIEESKRHNQAVEKLNESLNSITKYGKDIEARKVDYQQRQWETENWLNFERYGLQFQELGLKQLTEQHQYELGLMNAEAVGAQNLLRSQELDIKREQLSLEQQYLPAKLNLIKSQEITNYWNSVNSTLFHKNNVNFSDVLKGLTLIAPAIVP